MTDAIETRELFVLEGDGVTVRGTRHMTEGEIVHPGPRRGDMSRTGIVFLNSLSSTRAASGDSAVYWADSFAKRGYPAFRLDFPGFGDSEGDLPPLLMAFINNGGHAALASAKIEELAAEYNLSGVIVIGLCAGAVSALYTAAASTRCLGIVLMDPYFYLPLVSPSLLWMKLTGRISRTDFGRRVTNVYDNSKRRLASLRGNSLPENANFPLLRVWKDLASTGLPILIFKAPAFKARGEAEFDYFKYILELGGRNSRVTVKQIEGAGHTFSNRLGRTAARQHTEAWLDACFPSAGHDEPTLRALRAVAVCPGK